MSHSDLARVLANIAHPRILVLGDLILDRYTWGNAERISQEAPVIVLRADRREARLGGAANVANMLSALEARVSVAGVVGADVDADELRRLLADSGANTDLVLADTVRPTSVKERFVGRASSRHPSQILRVDSESCEPLAAALEKQLADQVASLVKEHDALLISDYGKGVCTPALLAAVIKAAKACRVPVIVDPSRACPLKHYRGVTIIKPNRLETELATGRKLITTADAQAAGHELCRELDAERALITLDSDGMMLVSHDGQGEIFPTQARAVYDITGAGDMVLAMIGLCLAGGTSPADAVRLANVAAGLEVERSGVAVIYRHEILAALDANTLGHKVVTLARAGELAEEHRRRGEKIVFTNGCFDLLHVGHVTYLSEAAALGDVLFVGVNSDHSVRKLKGPSRPVIRENDRASMLAALACVANVIVFDDDTPHALLQVIRPDVLVKGGTYTPEQVVGHEIVKAYGGRVCVTGVIDGVSTTNILAALSRGEPLRTTGAEEPDVSPTQAPATANAWRRAG